MLRYCTASRRQRSIVDRHERTREPPVAGQERAESMWASAQRHRRPTSCESGQDSDHEVAARHPARAGLGRASAVAARGVVEAGQPPGRGRLLHRAPDAAPRQTGPLAARGDGRVVWSGVGQGALQRMFACGRLEPRPAGIWNAQGFGLDENPVLRRRPWRQRRFWRSALISRIGSGPPQSVLPPPGEGHIVQLRSLALGVLGGGREAAGGQAGKCIGGVLAMG